MGNSESQDPNDKPKIENESLEMHHTFMHAHIPNSRFMVMAEMSTFGIFCGRNVQAEMSMAEMSQHAPMQHFKKVCPKHIELQFKHI